MTMTTNFLTIKSVLEFQEDASQVLILSSEIFGHLEMDNRYGNINTDEIKRTKLLFFRLQSGEKLRMNVKNREIDTMNSTNQN